jgi:metalloendopeptidase OMA1, mitochondrial
MKVLAVVLVTDGVVITIRYGTVEAVPFTNRTHFIIVVTPNFERKLGESWFASL